jgi:tRNA(Arg) A34 adenosine deaminase TadA
MCLSALYWSRIDRIYFGATRADAAEAGFDDEAIYRELAAPIAQRTLPISQMDRDRALFAFSDWRAQTGRTTY